MAETSFINQDVSDPFAVDYEPFDKLLDDAENIDPRVVSKAWTNLIKITTKYREQLSEIFSVLNDSIGSQLNTSSQGLHFFESIEERVRFFKTLKTIVDLNHKYIEFYEKATSSKENDNSFSTDNAKDKRKKQKTSHDRHHDDYERNKTRAVRNLLQIIVMPLNKVADSPTEAKEIVGQVARVAYKMIENSQTNKLTHDKELLDMVMSIIGCGIEKYSQSLGFRFQLIRLLQYKEQLAPLLADVVEFVVARHHQGLLIGEILEEIDRIDVRELSKDASCPRAISQFLVLLSEKCPKEFVPFIENIFGYLDQDSYMMRNASLQVMANIIILHLCMDDEEASQKQLRDEMMDAMLDHIRDITGYTRSRALVAWLSICDKNRIPITYIVKVTHAAVGRLCDKSCFVRKSAARFLVSVLHHNPFNKKLNLKAYEERYEEEKKVLDELLKATQLQPEKEDGETLSQCSSGDASITDETEPGKVHPVVQMKNLVLTEESAVTLQRRKVSYLQETIEFTKEILRATPLMVDMLTSKNVTDIQDAIEFFVTCNDLCIPEAVIGFKKMIRLINSKENNTADIVMNAYRKIFFNPDLKDTQVVANLLDFIKVSSIAESLSLEVLIGKFVESKDINDSMKRELWAIITGKKLNTSMDDVIAAVELVGMLARVQPEVIQHNLSICSQYGLSFSNYGEQECRLAREVCIAMRKSLPRKIEDKQKRPFMRLARDDILFTRLEDILVESMYESDFEHWFSFCDEALKVMFEMAESPDKICESLYRRLTEELLKNSVLCNSASTQENRDSPDFPATITTQTNGSSESSQPSGVSHNLEMVHPVALARFLHFLGDMALNMAVYLEHHVLIEIKTRSALASNTSLDDSKNKSVNNISVNNISISSRRRSMRFNVNKSGDEENLDEEVGLAGAEAEDVEMEFIGNICDDELVCGDSNLLTRAANFVVRMLADQRFQTHPLEIQLATSLALAKLMMVSVRFCNKHLNLLFTILEKSKKPEVKINLLIAISDLCVRFPNQLDGWTEKMYIALKSDNLQVRRAALKIISRLVLCDVIKPKEQIHAIANLICEDDEQLSTYSRHFFVELSKKQNAIYNVLPEIISQLSREAAEVNFRMVMKFIFALIDKSRDIERLIDKLCSRFKETDDERQWADVAYCLSLPKYSDTSMKKLSDRFECYKDKLCIDSVRESILSAVTLYKKTQQLKTGAKQLVEEFEARIMQAAGGADEEGGEEARPENGEQQTNGEESEGGDRVNGTPDATKQSDGMDVDATHPTELE